MFNELYFATKSKLRKARADDLYCHCDLLYLGVNRNILRYQRQIMVFLNELIECDDDVD